MVDSEGHVYPHASGFVHADSSIAILWSGEHTGERSLILPDEESVAVRTRIYFMASLDCTFNTTPMPAGRPNMMMLSYNTSYALRFDATNSSQFWIFNVHTLLIDEYEPDEILISLQSALDGMLARFWQCTIAALCGLFIVHAIRFPQVDLTRREPREPVEPLGPDEQHDPKEGFHISAPVTGWEVFWRLRLYLLVLVAIVVFWLSPASMDPDWIYPFYTWAAVTIVGWWIFNIRFGFTLDVRQLASGWLDLREVSRDQMDQLVTEAHTVGSPLGPVALVGHILYSRDKAHTQLELITNSLLIEDIASFQLKVMPGYLKFLRTVDTIVAKGYNEEVEEWKDLMKIRTGDNSSSTE